MNIASETRPSDPHSVVETTAGAVRGASRDGVFRFAGIPFGAPTERSGRFCAPEPAASWSGVRDALTFGPRAPQRKRLVTPMNSWIRDTIPVGEDCLVLNVFTPGLNDNTKRPVMVYMHGGAYERGSGSARGYDGSNLAKAGDVVVVTLNHRLNAFGYSFFEDIDPSFPAVANAGMLDIVLALRWVRDNAASFGGDADNVTIFGQSGGGSKVAVCMTMLEAKGLFHRAIIQSSSSHLKLATREDATKATEGLLDYFGLAKSQCAALNEKSVDEILEAHAAVIKAQNGNDSFRPVVDGNIIPTETFDLAVENLAADIPLMVGSCETEKAYFDMNADPSTLPLDDDQLCQKIMCFIGIDAAKAQGLISGYRQARPSASGRDLFNIIASDHQYRRTAVESAVRKVKQQGAPAYLYELTWKTPVLGGILNSPHNLCIPFVFGNTEAAKNFTGTGLEQEALSEAMMRAWIAFAHSGNPNHTGIPDWPPYDLAKKPTMIFDKECRLAQDPKPDDLARISTCPQFIADKQTDAV